MMDTDPILDIYDRSSLDPSLEPSRQVLFQQVTQVDCMARATTVRWVRSSRMPHAGYANSIMNDGPGFHLDISDKSSLNLSLEPLR